MMFFIGQLETKSLNKQRKFILRAIEEDIEGTIIDTLVNGLSSEKIVELFSDPEFISCCILMLKYKIVEDHENHEITINFINGLAKLLYRILPIMSNPCIPIGHLLTKKDLATTTHYLVKTQLVDNDWCICKKYNEHKDVDSSDMFCDYPRFGIRIGNVNEYYKDIPYHTYNRELLDFLRSQFPDHKFGTGCAELILSNYNQYVCFLGAAFPMHLTCMDYTYSGTRSTPLFHIYPTEDNHVKAQCISYHLHAISSDDPENIIALPGVISVDLILGRGELSDIVRYRVDKGIYVSNYLLKLLLLGKQIPLTKDAIGFAIVEEQILSVLSECNCPENLQTLATKALYQIYATINFALNLTHDVLSTLSELKCFELSIFEVIISYFRNKFTNFKILSEEMQKIKTAILSDDESSIIKFICRQKKINKQIKSLLTFRYSEVNSHIMKLLANILDKRSFKEDVVIFGEDVEDVVIFGEHEKILLKKLFHCSMMKIEESAAIVEHRLATKMFGDKNPLLPQSIVTEIMQKAAPFPQMTRPLRLVCKPWNNFFRPMPSKVHSSEISSFINPNLLLANQVLIEYGDSLVNHQTEFFGLRKSDKFYFDAGNCLFTAIAMLDKEKRTDSAIRALAVSHIRKDTQLSCRISEFAESNKLMLRIETFRKETLCVAGIDKVYTSLKEYLELMSQDKTCGTYIEIVALANALQSQIVILTPGNEYDHIIPENDTCTGNAPIFLNYTGGNHYEPLFYNRDPQVILEEISDAILCAKSKLTIV